jgi:hypothetical protein
MLKQFTYIILFVIFASTRSFVYGYDNPSGTTISEGITTSDTTITNEGTLGSATLGDPASLASTANYANIINSGNLIGAQYAGAGGVLAIYGSGSTFTNTNTGVISVYNFSAGIALIDGINQTVINNGLINSTDNQGGWGLWVVNPLNGDTTSVTNITNNGRIQSIASGGSNNQAVGFYLNSNTGSYNILNTGTIIADSAASEGGYGDYSAGIYVSGNSAALTITNTGTISASNGAYGISSGTYNVTTLNNLQGTGNEAGALTYVGEVPLNYNIIINSPTNYGQLAITSSSGNMAFGIYNTSTVAAGKYASVITGVDSGGLPNKSGTFGAFNWILSATDVSNTWDLIFSSNGPSPPDTQSSLTRLASRLHSIYNHQALTSNFPNSATYDCNLFDVKGMCISAGGRYSTVENPSSNSSAAVVTLGYKVNSNIRIGGFLDQSVTNNNPTGINLSNKNPMMGVFAYWNQNADGLGYQVKLANAYQDKDLSTTRDVIGTSEAGRGTTSLNARSYVGELSYAFMYKENTLARPYFALRHTSIEQDAYTETGVTTPLTYSALNNRTTSALMGVKFKHALTPKANLIGSLGVEQDLNNKTDRLTASGISGLTSENFSGNLHRTRPVASIGATYDIAKTQRLSGEVLVQQLPFQSTAGATAYFNYMIGF